MKSTIITLAVCIYNACYCQQVDTRIFQVTVEESEELNSFFTKDRYWRGGDGASSVDLGNERVLWLFSDSFICNDSSGLRSHSTLIRNSIAIQKGYDPETATLQYAWHQSGNTPTAFFQSEDTFWYWTGHGIMLQEKLLVFLMKVRNIQTGLSFEIFDWGAVLISNPDADPSAWQMRYLETPETFGTIAGSGAILSDHKYLYAFGAVEPTTHEVYALRWKLKHACTGDLMHPEWYTKRKWKQRKKTGRHFDPLFIGATEYSIHFDKFLKRFVHVQSYGFGAAEIGLRFSDRIQGPWCEPLIVSKPEYPGVREPFMYSVKAHPELYGKGLHITFNVNSFDLNELVENQTIYFPKFLILQFPGK